MRTITVLLCLALLMGGSAYGDQATPRGMEGSQNRKTGEGEIAPQGGPRFGPPPEAFQACEEKTAGSTAQFTKPDGETVTGTCRIADGRLVLRPDRPGENSRDDRRGPPPDAYKACEGKSAGSAAQFVSPRGETVKGQCQEEDGKLVLRPDCNKSSMPGLANDESVKGRVER